MNACFGPTRCLAVCLVGAMIACASPGASRAADVEVDLELALAIDVSGSVDEEEAALQRMGYIAAFRHPSVVEAIRHGPLGRIAVSYYEWAGFGHMKVVAPWTVIGDKASADAFATTLERAPPETARRTAIADAIDFGAASFDNNGYVARRRVIDISGDGPNNWGGSVTEARDKAVARGVTINGLPIINDRPSMFGLPPLRDLDLYYRDCVIGGPGAFYVVARDFKDFGRAVLRKLILEIADAGPAGAGRQARAEALHPKAEPPLLHLAADAPSGGRAGSPGCDAWGNQNFRFFRRNHEN